MERVSLQKQRVKQSINMVAEVLFSFLSIVKQAKIFINAACKYYYNIAKQISS